MLFRRVKSLAGRAMGKEPPEEDEKKTKRPANTPFKQQRLPAWQPLLTPKIVLPTLLILGILLAPIGGLLLMTVQDVTEIVIDYTDCDQAQADDLVDSPRNVYTYYGPAAEAEFGDGQSVFSTAASVLLGSGIGGANAKVKWTTGERFPPYIQDAESRGIQVKTCVIRFPVPRTLQPPVMMYVRMSNFYQNHRRYVSSFSAEQLQGEAVPFDQLNECDPVIGKAATDDESAKPYYPCGLIANSQFNDTISAVHPVTCDEGGSCVAEDTGYEFPPVGISWPSDSERYKPTQYQHDEILPPPNWQIRYADGKYDSEGPFRPPNLSTDELFFTWMRTAALPTFRKPLGRNNDRALPKGDYQVQVDYNYDTKSYEGTKAIVISTISPVGGRNPFLGVIYIALSVLCLVLSAAFTARHFIKPRRLGDHQFLSWNQPIHGTGSTQMKRSGEHEGEGESMEMRGVHK